MSANAIHAEERPMTAAGSCSPPAPERASATTPKQLARLGGRPLLQWAVDAQTSVDPDLLSPIVRTGREANTVTAPWNSLDSAMYVGS